MRSYFKLLNTIILFFISLYGYAQNLEETKEWILSKIKKYANGCEKSEGGTTCNWIITTDGDYIIATQNCKTKKEHFERTFKFTLDDIVDDETQIIQCGDIGTNN